MKFLKYYLKYLLLLLELKKKEFLNDKWSDLFSESGFRVDYIISPEDEVASLLARLVAVWGAHDLISFLLQIKLD